MNSGDSSAGGGGDEALKEAREAFINHWGAMGSAWGINRTMAQIHALLFTATEPMSTDGIMAELQISRGNANTNLRELASWGLIRSVMIRGERKEHFEAEKDVWKMFCLIARERKRREVSPTVEVLEECRQRTRGLRTAESRQFARQMKEIGDFLRLGETLLEKAVAMEESKAVALARKLFR